MNTIVVEYNIVLYIFWTTLMESTN